MLNHALAAVLGGGYFAMPAPHAVRGEQKWLNRTHISIDFSLSVSLQDHVSGISIHQLKTNTIDQQPFGRDAAQQAPLPVVRTLLQAGLKVFHAHRIRPWMDTTQLNDFQLEFHLWKDVHPLDCP